MKPRQTFHRLVWLIPGILALCLYSQSITHSYISLDDPWYTYENPMVVQGLSWEGIVWSASDSRFSNYHPITWWSHMLDFSLWGNSPGIFALMNALLHSVISVLTAFLISRITGSKTLGIVGGAIFAVHPALIEGVAWISQRKTLLSSLGGILCVLAYIKSLETVKRQQSLLYFMLSLGCYLCSLLAKSMWVTIPALLVLIELAMTPANKGLLRPFSLKQIPMIGTLAMRVTPFFLLSIIFSVVAVWAQRAGGAVSSLSDYSLGDRLGNVLSSYTLYLEKFFYPSGLSVFYPNLEGRFLYEQILSGFVLVVISLLLYAFRKRIGIVPLMGWFIFLVMLLPVIGLVQIGSQSHADRYMYGPVIGLILLVTCIGSSLSGSLTTRSIRTIAGVLGFSWFALLCLTSAARVSDWKNDFTLSRSSYETSPENPIIAGIYVNSLIKQGYLEEARIVLLSQIELYPNYDINYANLATCESILGDHEAATKYQRIFVALSPREGAGLTNLAKYTFNAGNHEEARQLVTRILESDYALRNTEREILRTLAEQISTDKSGPPDN